MKLTNLSIDNYTIAAQAIRGLGMPSDIHALALECLRMERSARRAAALEWQRQDRKERNKCYR